MLDVQTPAQRSTAQHSAAQLSTAHQRPPLGGHAIGQQAQQAADDGAQHALRAHLRGLLKGYDEKDKEIRLL